MSRVHRTIALAASTTVIAAGAVGVASIRALAADDLRPAVVKPVVLQSVTELEARTVVAEFMRTRQIMLAGEHRSGLQPAGAETFLSNEARAAYEQGIRQGVFELALYPDGPGEGWTYGVRSVSDQAPPAR